MISLDNFDGDVVIKDSTFTKIFTKMDGCRTSYDIEDYLSSSNTNIDFPIYGVPDSL